MEISLSSKYVLATGLNQYRRQIMCQQSPTRSRILRHTCVKGVSPTQPIGGQLIEAVDRRNGNAAVTTALASACGTKIMLYNGPLSPRHCPSRAMIAQLVFVE